MDDGAGEKLKPDFHPLFKTDKEGRDLVTIKDIANMSGVSRGTVDRVLNNRPGVNPKTAERVRMLADSLGYEPNIVGKSLVSKKKGIKLCFIFRGDIDVGGPVEREVKRKLQEYESYGVEIISRTVGTAAEMLKVLDECCDAGIKGAVLSPVADEAVIKKISELSETGIKIVLYDNNMPEVKRLAYVGCDYYRNGEVAAGAIKLILQKKGNVAILTGEVSDKFHHERVEGCLKHLGKTAPDINIGYQAVCPEGEIDTYAATKEMLERYPEADLLFLNVVHIPGAIRAVEEGKHIPYIISTNRISELQSYMERGIITAAITHQPWLMGSLSLDILFRNIIWGKEPDFETFYTNNEIIIAENVERLHLT